MADLQQKTGDHLAGLDTLRFVAAAWVALSHGARLPLSHLLEGGPLVTFNNVIFNGVAAVMLFYVVSGYVIHRPYVGASEMDIRAFYARRLTRIVPPVAVAQLACMLLGPEYEEGLSSVLWSLYCEIAYYWFYPMLLPLFGRGWTGRIFLATTIVSFALIAATWPTTFYWELSLPVLIAIGLPSWILGCVLAERRAARTPRDVGAEIWAWRLGAVALGGLLKWPLVMRPVMLGYPTTNWIFAIFAFFWIARELDRYAHRPAPRWSELAGRASFSLYLVHLPVITAFGLAYGDAPPLGGLLGAGAAAWLGAWALVVPATAAATYAFYLAVEAPCHRLARRLGRSLGQARLAQA